MSFFDEYFKYVGRTEAPMIYLRWSAISMVSAILGRETWFPFGHKQIFPNQFILLMGTPGARKGTGLGITRSLLEASGYRTFAKDKTSMERFIVDMVPKLDMDEDLEALVLDVPAESYICMDEFLDFIGHGNMPFLTLLTNLWDNKDSYEHPKLHGASVTVFKPTINVLGAATVKGFGLACPPEALGTGILSRIILIHSEPTDEKITWPEEVPEDANAWLIQRLRDIREQIKGKMTIRSDVKAGVLDRVYQEFPGIEDARFSDYSSRRFTHLLKLCIVLAAMDLRMEVNEQDVLEANTILYAAERNMPRALGEFGKSKHSDVTNTVMGILNHAVKPVLHSKLWKATAKDLTKQSELHDIMRNLLAADKIQVMTIAGVQGYMAKNVETKTWDPALILRGYLTDKEEMF